MIDRQIIDKVVPLILTCAALLGSALPASALSMKECSVKFKAAQDAGQANGISWSDFRKAECSTKAADTPADESATDAQPADDTPPAQARNKSGKPATKAASAAKAGSGGTTFPSSIATKFASETPARGRMHTCLEQYHVNKDRGTLGGMRWIERGGGYYKLCNAKLKDDG